jgi:hypothetical protein
MLSGFSKEPERKAAFLYSPYNLVLLLLKPCYPTESFCNKRFHLPQALSVG